MTKRFFYLASIFIIFGTGCSNPSAFRIPEKQFYQKIKTIAIAPVQGLTEKPHATQEAKEHFASMIKDWTEKAGFSVVPPEKIQEIWTRIAEDEEYRYNMAEDDPETVRLKKIRIQVLHEIGEKFGADAVLISNIIKMPVQFRASLAQWDGTSQSVQQQESRRLAGTIAVISLEIAIQDIKEGNELYHNRAGIQVLETFGRIAVAKWGFTPIPQEDFLGIEDRNTKAIKRGLAPLLPEETSPQDPS